LAKGDTTYLDPDPLSPALMDQIKSWIETCDDVHRPCRLPVESKNVLPYRVIDVGPSNGCNDPFLSIGHDRLGEYATLSYRWGTTATLTSATDNIGSRQCKIPLEMFPPTIRDGIVLVRKLGIRYLWIDALCILQDSPSDWAEQSALMGQIYYRALLNIAVDSAQNTLEGFLKPRSILNVRSCEHPSLFGTDGPMKVICPSIPDAQRVVGNGALSKRGWIFQERALSRRILHWTSYEVAWECNAFTATERQPSFCNWPESRWDEIRHVVRRVGPQPGDQTIPDHVSKISEEIPGAQVNYDQWYRLVEKYAERVLTKSKDKLPAISGLATMFQLSMDPRPDYVSGLWAEDLVMGLAWEIEDRWLPGHSNVWPLPRHHDRLKGLSQYRAPSFSWASVDTGVIFMDNDISHTQWKFVPELDAQVLDYANQPSSHNAFGEVSQSFVRLRGLGIAFSQLHHRVKEGRGLQGWRPAYETRRRVCNDHHGSYVDWDLLAPRLILLCLRARVDPTCEEYVMRRIEKTSLAGRTTHRRCEESTKQRFRSRCRRAFISAKSATEDLTGSGEQDPLRVGYQFCLMLLPTGTEEGQFYRIGLYVEEHFLLGLSKWKEMTVTVV
jgi:Heterokaryon incompatibility protein (HET)